MAAGSAFRALTLLCLVAGIAQSTWLSFQGVALFQALAVGVAGAAGLFAGALWVARKFACSAVEHSLRSTETRSQLAAIVESSEDAIIGMNLEGEITSWNAGAETIYGYSAEEILHRPITLLNPPDRPNEIPQLMKIIKQGKGINRYESERIQKDGRRIYVSASISPIKDVDGAVIGASTIVRDVTTVKKFEENLRAHASQMETLYTVAQDVGATLSLNEVMERSLKRVITASGFDYAFLRFYDAAEQFRSLVASVNADLPSESLESLKYLSEATVERMPDPNQAWFVGDASTVSGMGSVYDAANVKALAVLPFPRSAQLHGALTLMSPRAYEFSSEQLHFLHALAQQIGLAVENASLYGNTLQINAHLHEEIEERKRAEKRLADFTAMAVHDLRGPLSNLASIAESLQNEAFGAINDEQRQWLGKMEASCVGLVEQISHFLDLSKMEAGHIELNSKPVDIGSLLCESIFQYSIQADKRDIKLALALEPDLPLINADARRINQVVENLLNNALKFTRDGGHIEVGARRENAYQITGWVKDNGIGIPPNEISRIFEKYRQVASGEKAKAFGTGLGLAICKKIVEAHDGVLWVESKENEGTTLFFSLPANQTDSTDILESQLSNL